MSPFQCLQYSVFICFTLFTHDTINSGYRFRPVDLLKLVFW